MRLGYIGQDASLPDDTTPSPYQAASGDTSAADATAATQGADTRPWYTQLRDWLADSAVVNAATAARDYTVDETQKAIADLYSTGLDFQDAHSQLVALSDQVQSSGDPTLRSQYADLVSRGNVVGDTISGAVKAVQNVVQWVKDNVGVDISATSTPPPGLQGLGFVQLVPLAIIGAVVAATALAAAWIVDARSAITKINALQTLVQSVPADQRAQVISSALQQSGGLTKAVSSVTGLVFAVGIVGALIYFAPQLKRLVKGSQT